MTDVPALHVVTLQEQYPLAKLFLSSGFVVMGLQSLVPVAERNRYFGLQNLSALRIKKIIAKILGFIKNIMKWF